MLIEKDEHEMAAFIPDWGGRGDRGKEGKERGERKEERGAEKERKE